MRNENLKINQKLEFTEKDLKIAEERIKVKTTSEEALQKEVEIL